VGSIVGFAVGPTDGFIVDLFVGSVVGPLVESNTDVSGVEVGPSNVGADVGNSDG